MYANFQAHLPKNGFLESKFQTTKSGFGIRTPSFLMDQFSVNVDNFELLRLNLKKLPDICDIKVRITLRVLQRAGWRLR